MADQVTPVILGVLAGAAIGAAAAYLILRSGHPDTISYPRPPRSRDPHNRGRRAAFRAQLGGDPFVEAVELLPDGTAVFWRRRRPVARFEPTPYQLAKIRSGRGEIVVYLDQIVNIERALPKSISGGVRYALPERA